VHVIIIDFPAHFELRSVNLASRYTDYVFTKYNHINLFQTMCVRLYNFLLMHNCSNIICNCTYLASGSSSYPNTIFATSASPHTRKEEGMFRHKIQCTCVCILISFDTVHSKVADHSHRCILWTLPNTWFLVRNNNINNNNTTIFNELV